MMGRWNEEATSSHARNPEADMCDSFGGSFSRSLLWNVDSSHTEQEMF